MNWYYALEDQRQGPVSETEFERLIAGGTITETTLVWKQGMDDWAPLKQVLPAGATETSAPEGWIRCTSTGRYFPPEEIVYLEGRPYSAEAKAAVLQGLMQTGTLGDGDVGRTGPGWEKREQLGFFPAIWQTVRGVMTQPSETFSQMKREGGIGAPLGYYVLMGWLGSVINQVYAYFHIAVPPFIPNGNSEQFQAIFGGWFLAIIAVFTPFILILFAFLLAGIVHLALMLFQGAKQPFETTFRTYCYVRGSMALLLFIPEIGSLGAFFWEIVALCIAVARTHEINTGRAVGAVLFPIVLCIGLFAVLFAIGLAFGASEGFGR